MNRRIILGYILSGIIASLLFQIIFIFDIFSVFTPLQKTFRNHHESMEIPCKIENKQAKSALKRIKSQDCKQNVIQTYCDIKQKAPWKEEFISNCHKHGRFRLLKDFANFSLTFILF